MSKVKRGLQLAAAIVGIVFNSILVLACIYTANIVSTYVSSGAFYGYYGLILLVYIGSVLLSIANIVICSIICSNPEKRGNGYEHKGLTITALVLSAVIVLLYSASADAFLLVPLITCGLFIAVLCIPKEKSNSIVVNSTQNTINYATTTSQNVPATSGMQSMPNNAINAQNGDFGYSFKEGAISQIADGDSRKQIIRQAVENIEKKTTSNTDENIARIRKLYQDSVLTADEMKNLIMEELKKQK